MWLYWLERFFYPPESHFRWEIDSPGLAVVSRPGWIKGRQPGTTILRVSSFLPGERLKRPPWPGSLVNFPPAGMVPSYLEVPVKILPSLDLKKKKEVEVIAAYYPWFSERYHPPPPRPRWSEDWSAFTPLVKPYDPQSRRVLLHQVLTAQSGGIDGFCLSWFTFRRKYDFDYQSLFQPTMDFLREIAPQYDFHIYILYESHMNLCPWSSGHWLPLQTPKEKKAALRGATQDFTYLLEWMSDFEEKPTIYVYLAEAIGLTPAAWEKVIAPLRSKFPQARWFADTYNLAYLECFDGLFRYGAFLEASLLALYPELSQSVHEWSGAKQFVATVGPGFDASHYWGFSSPYIPRQGGLYYRFTWEKALKAKPDGVFITSWNEWGETTAIEPALEYGYLYLDLTAEYVSRLTQAQPRALNLGLWK